MPARLFIVLLCVVLAACASDDDASPPAATSAVVQSSAPDSVPDCAGIDRSPASMAFVHLKNAGLSTGERVDLNQSSATRIASEKRSDSLWRQVHLVRFVEKAGDTISVITANDVSHEECSMSAVEVYVVSQRLGDTLR